MTDDLASLPADELVTVACCDLVAMVRGRSFPARDLPARLATGVGWVPANQSLTAFGTIAEPNPHGSIGDLRLLPDPATRVRVPVEGAPPLHLVLATISTVDGAPWEACARAFCADAIAELERETGLGLVASFEHELTLLGGEGPTAPPFSVAAHRALEPFLSRLAAALAAAGCEPDTIFPEYGPWQAEVPVAPARGLAAADRAVLVRELVREVARLAGLRATLAPLVDPEGVGNGVHVHWSLVDRDGTNVTAAAGDPGAPGDVAGAIAAGILDHLPALVALTAGSPASAMRLAPHRWSAGFGLLGASRETALRMAPVVTAGGADPTRSANVEYRAADATASPHLVLGALAAAGLDGVRRGLAAPPVLRDDPNDLAPDALAALGPARVPTTAAAALAALEADDGLRALLPPLLLETYVGIRRAELAHVVGWDDRRIVAAYAERY